MGKIPTLQEWEDSMLKDPLASRVSGEYEEHTPDDQEFIPLHHPDGKLVCKCRRCIIIRIKRRRAFRFPMTKCPGCGELFLKFIYPVCEQCRNPNPSTPNGD